MGPHKIAGSSSERKKHKHSKKKKDLKKKRKRDTSESTDSEEERKRKLKKKMKKLQKQKKEKDKEEGSTDIPLALMEKSKAMAPMTKAEWEKKQSIVRRVFDEGTGRYRLVKGDGEVIEEIVSKDRHKAINQLATKGDGDFFQAQVSSALQKKKF